MNNVAYINTLYNTDGDIIAKDLDPDALDVLAQAMAKETGKEVVLETETVSWLIGPDGMELLSSAS